MVNVARATVSCITATFLASCTSLFSVHDPQTGIISAGQLPDFIKSVRCELVTFYEIERSRKAAYEHAILHRAPYSQYAYFEIAPLLFGAFTLELKVTDNLGIGSGTAIDLKRTIDATHSNTLHFGPTLSGQGTYDLIWTFLMKQNASLSVSHHDGPDKVANGACFNGPLEALEDLERLAEENPPVQAQFTRILVNGHRPLAAWLRDNGTLLSMGHLKPTVDSEAAEPAQMYYSFAVQVIAGLEAKYTLLTPQWNPLAGQGSGSLQQNSNLQIYINGPGAAYANAAKSGTSGFGPVHPQLGTAENPMHVIQENLEGFPTIAPREPPKNAPRPRRAPPSKGYLLAPVPVFPPSPSQ